MARSVSGHTEATITFNNLRTGRSHVFGRLEVDVLKRSFFGAN